MIIWAPSYMAVCKTRAEGSLVVLIGAQELVVGL